MNATSWLEMQRVSEDVITPIFQVMKFMILFRWEVVNAAVVSVSLKTSEMHVSDADSSKVAPTRNYWLPFRKPIFSMKIAKNLQKTNIF